VVRHAGAPRYQRVADGGSHRVGAGTCGGSGGAVEIYRETGNGRTSVGRAQLAADGSYSFQDDAPTSPTLYRAVYVDAATMVPYASLLRQPIG
jgi:hypothetical protein